MKTLRFLKTYWSPILMLLIASCGGAEREINVKELQKRGDGLFYAVNESEPFSGKVITIKEKNGQKILEETYIKGTKEGLETHWSPNGDKKGVYSYQAGKLNGSFTEWHLNGKKWREGTIKNDKYDGELTQWTESGLVEKESLYKDGKEEIIYLNPEIERSKLLSQLKKLGSKAQRFYSVGKQYGGGGNSFTGFALNPQDNSNETGKYNLTIVEPAETGEVFPESNYTIKNTPKKVYIEGSGNAVGNDEINKIKVYITVTADEITETVLN